MRAYMGCSIVACFALALAAVSASASALGTDGDGRLMRNRAKWRVAVEGSGGVQLLSKGPKPQLMRTKEARKEGMQHRGIGEDVAAAWLGRDPVAASSDVQPDGLAQRLALTANSSGSFSHHEPNITTCKLVKVEVATPEYEYEQFNCELESLGGYVELVDLSPASKNRFNTCLTESDDCYVRIKDAVVQNTSDGRKLLVKNGGGDGMAELSQETSVLQTSLGDKHTGTKTLVVVRVSASDKSSPFSSEEISRRVFGGVFGGVDDKVNLAMQYDKCSYGKLKFIKATGEHIQNGVLDIDIGINVSGFNKENRGTLQAAAFESTNKLNATIFDKIDYVMFCFPPVSGWLAYAFVNKKFSFYNGEYCASISAQMHEVGHNLGLGHAGSGGHKYADMSGYLGYSWSQHEEPSMCFNAKKSWQLGWYEDRSRTVDPQQGASTVKLVGVSEYNQTGVDQTVLVQVILPFKSGEEDNYLYIAFNRANGFNNETKEGKDKVMLVSGVGVRNEDGSTWSSREAMLGSLESFTLPEKIEVFVSEIVWGSPVYATVSIRNTEITPPPDCNVTDGSYFNSRPFCQCGSEICKSHEGCVAASSSCQPPPCATYTIELTTDDYPNDNTWSIFEEIDDARIGLVIGSQPNYTEKLTLYTTDVCLPYNKKYKFEIKDKYGDGLCCGQGKGSYRGLGPDGAEIFGNVKDGINAFEINAHSIEVGTAPPTLSPNPSPTSSPAAACKAKPEAWGWTDKACNKKCNKKCKTTCQKGTTCNKKCMKKCNKCKKNCTPGCCISR